MVNEQGVQPYFRRNLPSAQNYSSKQFTGFLQMERTTEEGR